MPVRVVSPVLSFVRWLFAPAAPGVDLFFALLGCAWIAFLTAHPSVFDTGNYRGMDWLPDAGWLAFLVVTTALHCLGLARPHWIMARVAAGLLTAWFWMLVAISLTRIGLVPGSFTYGLIGAAALFSAIYVSGSREGA